MTVVSLEAQDQGDGVVEIDRCDVCGGTFLEFFDGEPIGLAQSAIIDAPERRAQPPTGAAQCPDCERPMVNRPYLEDGGPVLARCDTCLAVFVSRDQLESLAEATLDPLDEATPTWFGRLLALFN